MITNCLSLIILVTGVTIIVKLFPDEKEHDADLDCYCGNHTYPKKRDVEGDNKYVQVCDDGHWIDY